MINRVWRICLGILGGFFPYLMRRKKNSGANGGHVVFKYKNDEFEGIVVINFRFMEKNLDVPWP